MQVQTLNIVLEEVAKVQPPRGILVYPLGNTTTSMRLSYQSLISLARSNSRQLNMFLDGFEPGTRVLLHFEDPLDSIIWFWSVLYAGGIPAMSTPFSSVPEQRRKHIEHLQTVLQNPICLTRHELLGQFDVVPTLDLHTIESLDTTDHANIEAPPFASHTRSTDAALLMLTSGSAGNAKIVCLTHAQILAAVAGKASIRSLPDGLPFLNWINLDHVASLVEIHIQALFLHRDQIHIRPSDIILNPLLFLELIDKHRVTRTFAPNFFLKLLVTSLNDIQANGLRLELDLSCLRFLASGGEPNAVETCVSLLTLLQTYGAPQDVIVSGFGMTETCAGAIFHLDCPTYDVEKGYEYAAVGACIPGINMRVSGSASASVCQDKPGELEVSGPVVFRQYLNNPLATSEAFTSDGWFRTGDQAIIDAAGKLRLVGRIKETISINGVKYLPHEIEFAIEDGSIAGVIPSFTVCFPYRSIDTEQICIAYLPTYQKDDVKARIQTQHAITKITMLQTGTRPYVLPLDAQSLQKTSLGKLSRSKIKTAFERGDYQALQSANDLAIQQERACNNSAPSNELEVMLLELLSDSLALSDIGVNTSIFDLGVTSIDLIKLKTLVEKSCSIESLPMSTIMVNPTVRSLAVALRNFGTQKPYDPIVVLRHQGKGSILWLIHPGVGEVLVFLNLAKLINDRPVYAIRARGFDGEPYFENIKEAVMTYHKAIKAKQPNGPYAMAGYSYGAMLAFELAKLLESNRDEVQFLASFNLPPHIETRMKQLDWSYGLLHLSYFLGLIPEQRAHEVAGGLRQRSRDQAVSYIMGTADRERLRELSLTAEALVKWADLSFGLQSMARDYKPSGNVASMDVFFATPLQEVSPSRPDWMENHMSKWSSFCREEPRFHEVEGSHYTILAPEHVNGFQKILKQAMRDRNI